MGLIGRLDRLATRRPHVLLVEVPGWWPLRLAVEAELGRRGGVVAESPAQADALVVVGAPDDRWSELVGRLWQQLPGPRARGAVTSADDVAGVLDALVTDLADRGTQRRDALERSGFEPGDGDHMAPSGIPLASGSDDRDGLEMDVLHLPLGPVLRHWPAGLVVRCTLSGDLVTEVDVDHLGAADDAPAPPLTPQLQAARCLDSALSVLALAGSAEQSLLTRRLRDALVVDDRPVAVQALRELHGRIGRSRTLRWMLRDVGRYQGTDAHDRLLASVEDASAYLDGGDVGRSRPEPDVLTQLLPGVELAQVRLVMASLGPWPTTAATQVSHG